MKNQDKERKKGCYSVNKTIFSFFIFTVIFIFVTSSDLSIKATQINNQYLRTIVTSILKPISAIAERAKVSDFFSNTRKRVLEIARLEKEVNWENFYYIEDDNVKIENIWTGKKENTFDDEKDIAENVEIEEHKRIDNSTNAPTEKKPYLDSEPSDSNEKNNDAIDKSDDTSIKDEKLPPSPYIYDEKNPFHILMIGDSQMYSLANGLKKLTTGQDSIEITDIAIHSSGFIRGDYYNWEKKLENVFNEKPKGYYHVAVVLLGMNDYQDIYNNTKVLLRETKAWEETYKDKIVRVLNLLLLNTKKVYWLGMPIVRRASYNDDLRYIDSVQDEVANEYNHIGLARISLASIAPGIGVPYTDTIQKKDGKIIRLMKNDGIHYTLLGGQHIMEDFLLHLYNEWYIKKAN